MRNRNSDCSYPIGCAIFTSPTGDNALYNMHVLTQTQKPYRIIGNGPHTVSYRNRIYRSTQAGVTGPRARDCLPPPSPFYSSYLGTPPRPSPVSACETTETGCVERARVFQGLLPLPASPVCVTESREANRNAPSVVPGGDLVPRLPCALCKPLWLSKNK